jgi:hypothetical protein
MRSKSSTNSMMLSSPNPLFIEPKTGTRPNKNDAFKRQNPDDLATETDDDLETRFDIKILDLDTGLEFKELDLGDLQPRRGSGLFNSFRVTQSRSRQTAVLLLIAVVSFIVAIVFGVQVALASAGERETPEGEWVDDASNRPPTPVPGPAPSPVDPSNPLIRLSFATEVNADVEAVFQGAVSFWNDIVTNDLERARSAKLNGNCAGVNLPKDIDGLFVDVTIIEIDGESGVLGSAGPCAYQFIDDRWRPRVGLMRFDEADVLSLLGQGRLDEVIRHEIAHVLGFGTLWRQAELLQTDESLDADHRYVGKHGGEGYRALDGYESGSSSPYVPVENRGGVGTTEGHWRDGIFKTEVSWLACLNTWLE